MAVGPQGRGDRDGRPGDTKGARPIFKNELPPMRHGALLPRFEIPKLSTVVDCERPLHARPFASEFTRNMSMGMTINFLAAFERQINPPAEQQPQLRYFAEDLIYMPELAADAHRKTLGLQADAVRMQLRSAGQRGRAGEGAAPEEFKFANSPFYSIDGKADQRHQYEAQLKSAFGSSRPAGRVALVRRVPGLTRLVVIGAESPPTDENTLLTTPKGAEVKAIAHLPLPGDELPDRSVRPWRAWTAIPQKTQKCFLVRDAQGNYGFGSIDARWSLRALPVDARLRNEATATPVFIERG